MCSAKWVGSTWIWIVSLHYFLFAQFCFGKLKFGRIDCAVLQLGNTVELQNPIQLNLGLGADETPALHLKERGAFLSLFCQPEHADEGVDLELRPAVRPHLVDGAEERHVRHDDDVVLRPVGDFGRPVKHALRRVTHHVAALRKERNAMSNL